MQFIEGNIAVRQLGEQAQTSSMPSQPGPPPDIARQFTNNLQNLANILSSSQPANTSMGPENISSQSIAVNVETGDGGVEATDSKDMKCEGGMLGSSPLPTTWDDVEHLFEGYDDKEKAAIQRERTRRIEEQNRMFAARKLCLVLDLDHTLLNSAKFVEVDRVHEEILRKKEELDREKPQRHLFRFPHMSMWTKLRQESGLFLRSKLYELHLYTMGGNNVYAKEMAKVLDPTGVLFAGRVISKGDEGDLVDGDEKPKSKDWKGYTTSPVVDANWAFGSFLLEIDHDERPEDGTIASSLAVIERIHENFFSNPSLRDMDVRNILSLEQRRFGWLSHSFSRIFPLGGANHLLHPLWQTAEQFGAVCTTQIDEQVTHVVANSLGTDKVNWALATGRYVVHPGWVEASALLYRRANELDFAVKP
ncbi:hypothetical protein GIB67_017172 [Kingdonia uniflora]|uniref:protein-serine/threonine phosphatase n=1 Tax=Kingdonia uniflora TaxID=39325 RepID=A0A7J7KZN8_9MAGN|nr:hypothetical protein GIB67_017172 [Kingdonia uniflora]